MLAQEYLPIGGSYMLFLCYSDTQVNIVLQKITNLYYNSRFEVQSLGAYDL